MMDCISGFASSISRDLVVGTTNQLRYPCCFNDFIEDLEQEEEKLITTRNSVEDRVKHARKQVIKNAEVVNAWLEKSNPLKDKAEDLIRKARTNKSCCFGYCPNWIWKYHLAKKLAKRRKEVEMCVQEGKMYIQYERIASLPSKQHFLENCLKFDSREGDYEELLEALKDDEVTTIGLYGMGGCGKTTMAMELMRTAEAENLFDKVLFVSVSNIVDVRKIQDRIASALQFQFPEGGESERAQRLRARLNLDDQRTLVILDDLWQSLDFGVIGIPSGQNHRNCKVLITTQYETVCSLMNCQRMIYLSTLTDEEAWELFQNQAQLSGSTSDNLKHLGRLISDECKGLPVAIAALASTLKGKAEDDWNVALVRLRNSIPVNIERGLKDPYKCFRVSYDNLDTKEAKSLFLLCSVFPEGYEIPVETLIRFAIGLGMVGEVWSYEEARSEVCAAKNKLISSCLLSDMGGGKRVKMHDLVRDVALCIASNDNKVIKCVLEKSAILESRSIRYLLCKEFPSELNCSSIELLCLETNSEVSDEMFRTMGRLQVLFLSCKGLGTSSLSTMSFKWLINLRCLWLKMWKLGDISSMGYMTKLESLTLLGCSFLELTEDVMAQLTKLRLLHLSECKMERNPFQVIGRRPSLEELYIDGETSKWDNGNGGQTEFFRNFRVPQALARYHIQLGHKFKGHGDKILSCRRTLILSCFDTSNASAVALAEKAEVLLLANIVGGAQNITPDIFQIEREGFMDYGWIQLWLCDSDEIKCLVENSNHPQQRLRNMFSRLRQLRLERMKKFGALYHGVPPSGLFEKLEHLYISKCPLKTRLFTPAIARGLQQLEKLEIFSCDELKHILEDEEISGQDHRVIFSKLKKLHIMGCQMLEYVIPVTFSQGLVQLESLDIDYCGELKYVFGECSTDGDTGHQNGINIEFPALQVLRLTDNWNMIGIFPQCYRAGWPSLHKFYLEYCPKLKIMSINTFKANECKDTLAIEKDFLSWETICIHKSKVETIFSLEQAEIIEQPVRLQLRHLELSHLRQMKHICVGLKNFFVFQNLKTLEIKRCEKLEVTFPASVMRCLPELKHLKIIKCRELKLIIEEGDAENHRLSNCVPPQPCFPKLSELIITDCQNLESLFLVPESNDLPNLEVLIIVGAGKLKELIRYEERQSDQIRNVQVKLPKLKLLMLMSMSNLCQEIELPSAALCVIDECPKFPLTSSVATFKEFERKISELDIDLEDLEIAGIDQWKVLDRVREINKSDQIEEEEAEIKIVGKSSYFDIPSTSTSPLDIAVHKAHSHELMDDQSVTELSFTNQQKPLGKIRAVQIPQSIEGIEKTCVGEVPASLKPISPIFGSEVVAKPLYKIPSINVEDKIKEGQKMQDVKDSIQEQEQPHLSDKQVVSNSNIEVHGDSSMITKLEAFKQFADLDDAQIALLAEAIAVYPHLWKVVEDFSMRFQAWMLKTLVDILFFLRNESPASVTPQGKKDFQKLCDEAIQLGFDKSWIHEMHQRVMVMVKDTNDNNNKVDHAQEQLGELLKKHDHLTEQLQSIKAEIVSLRDFVDSHKRCFDFL
ncbi:putative disease resistance protein RGA3 isoform X1 [Arachis stenosperma]|uniref:putative disease resistance protein RGA3 isoform X1 n=1 Tax=Arachis stenosperma TaxID=217475 RepID=UPI0025ABCEAF|nr:putative disease resistance protein RGA3 isoform X1 [Arachis stenosperma]